jgi:two-component system, OmpR family, KDP operon response regulator KdpE
VALLLPDDHGLAVAASAGDQEATHGEHVDLTPRELTILAYLAHHARKVCTRRMILGAVWGHEYSTELHYLKVNAYRIRRKLHDGNGEHLQSDRSVCYRFSPPDE